MRGDQGRDQQPADDDSGQRSLDLSSKSRGQEEWHDCEDRGEGRHQDRPELDIHPIHDRFFHRFSLFQAPVKSRQD